MRVANLIAGWLLFWCLLWLCWATGAPVVAEAYKQPAQAQHVCPMPIVKHGVGSDLRTFRRVRDLCAD